MLHFFLVPLFHVALYLRVALFPCYTFSCCIFFILHSSPVALFSCCIFFLLQFIRVAPCFPVALLHCFPVALFSCCFLFHTALFTCCNFFSLDSQFWSVSCYTLFMLNFFAVTLSHTVTFPLLHTFRNAHSHSNQTSMHSVFNEVAVLWCCGLFRLHFFMFQFFHVALFRVASLSCSTLPGCNIFLLYFPKASANPLLSWV